MIRFFIGVVVGAVLVFSAVIVSNPIIRFYVGSFLDEDFIYLKGGTIIRGWIIKESNETIFVKTKSGLMPVPRAICTAVQKNVPLYYMRALM